MKKLITVTVLASLALPAMAIAADTGAPAAGNGDDTRALLELQRSGQAASPTERPMSGDVAARTNQRYVDSFSQPIPKSLSEEEQAFVKDKQ